MTILGSFDEIGSVNIEVSNQNVWLNAAAAIALATELGGDFVMFAIERFVINVTADQDHSCLPRLVWDDLDENSRR